jgi:Uma2 family endonuclease
LLAIIEVAESSIRFDREVKAPLYAKHGIREYWIDDLQTNQIEVFSKPQGNAYTTKRVFRPGDEISLMGKELSVKELLILG